jgi:predicted nucleic acid-binding protein
MRKDERLWATCPLTENRFLRIISTRSYSNPITLGDARSLLKAQTARTGHNFWPDDLSVADDTIVDHRYLLHPSQITDAYLLALAAKHNGRLVTFDPTVPLAAARNARPENLLVLL